MSVTYLTMVTYILLIDIRVFAANSYIASNFIKDKPRSYFMEAAKEQFAAYGADTPEFTLAGKTLWTRVVSVYDGDTMTIVMPVDGKMWRFAARMYGIDTCEMRSKEAANRETAIRARNRVVELITGVRLGADAGKKEIQKLLAERVYVVRIECLDFDKYGRVLVRVFVPGDGGQRVMSDVLLEEKLAYPYFGDTKMGESDQVSRLAAAVASNTI